jgi:CRISPR-associated protein Csm4
MAIMKKTARDYQELVCVIEPRSAFLTPMQADTLWGTLAWACRWIYGEAALQDYLTSQADDSPKLLLSDAFPEDMLPRPRQAITVSEIRKAIEDRGINVGDEDYLEKLATAKGWLKRPYLERREVFDLLRGTTTQSILISQSLGKVRGKSTSDGTSFEPHPRRHNIIDRRRGGSLRENGLYTHQEMWLENRWIIYLRTTFPAEWVRPLFDYVGESGFGKRASTGMGRFIIHDLRPPKSHEQFPAVSNADSFMTLSSAYVPSESEIAEGAFYTLQVKRGKLGAAMPTDSIGGFLKHPIAMCCAGSIFNSNDPARLCFGRLIDDIHREHKEIKHYGFAFPVAGKLFD